MAAEGRELKRRHDTGRRCRSDLGMQNLSSWINWMARCGSEIAGPDRRLGATSKRFVEMAPIVLWARR